MCFRRASAAWPESYDIIAIYKLDRLGRSLQHLAQLIGELKTHRTALLSTSQGIDTSESNSASRLQMNVLLAVAEFERDAIIERINAGLAAAAIAALNSAGRGLWTNTALQLQNCVAAAYQVAKLLRASTFPQGRSSPL
jgi:DNA invertase Pin-like site-specific DNA recombinase